MHRRTPFPITGKIDRYRRFLPALLVSSLCGCGGLLEDHKPEPSKTPSEVVTSQPQVIPKRPEQPKEEAKPEVDPFIEAIADMQSEDEERLKAGSKTLAQLEVDDARRAQVVKLLIPLLAHESPVLRGRAGIGLGIWANESTVPALLEQMNALEVQSHRRMVIGLLRDLKTKQAIEPLAARLTSAFDREDAIKALIAIGENKENVELLEETVIELLESTNGDVRLAVCRILNDVGTTESIEALEDAVEDQDPRVATAALRAVQAIESR